MSPDEAHLQSGRICRIDIPVSLDVRASVPFPRRSPRTSEVFDEYPEARKRQLLSTRAHVIDGVTDKPNFRARIAARGTSATHAQFDAGAEQPVITVDTPGRMPTTAQMRRQEQPCAENRIR